MEEKDSLLAEVIHKIRLATIMATALISASTPPQTVQLGNATIYVEPRISANQLAQFVVSDPAKQETIVRNARKAITVRVANYQPARSAIPKCHSSAGIDHGKIIEHANRMETTAFEDSFEQQCNALSAAALRRVASIASQIDCSGVRVHTPQRGFDHLVIEGVRVSIQPEIVVSFAHRGATKFGGVLFNFSKTPASSLENGNGRYTAGDYAAALVFMMLGVHFGAQGGPRNGNCFAVDVYRDSIFPAPASYKTMLKNIEAACRNIARQWDVEENAASALDDDLDF